MTSPLGAPTVTDNGDVTQTPRWLSQTTKNHSQWYVERFRALAASGADLDGEARFIDAVAARGARILDAGCGTGRLGGALRARGHVVTGVDVDPVLIEEARRSHPEARWELADLTTVELEDTFDVIVCAGNVMVFLAPGTERMVVERLAGLLRPGGGLVLGFRTDRDYTLPALDADLAAAGLDLEQRFATWDLRPISPTADFAITLARRRAG